MEKVGSLRKLDTIAEALEDIRVGKLVIVVDDPARENAGPLLVSHEKCTPDTPNPSPSNVSPKLSHLSTHTRV